MSLTAQQIEMLPEGQRQQVLDLQRQLVSHSCIQQAFLSAICHRLINILRETRHRLTDRLPHHL